MAKTYMTNEEFRDALRDLQRETTARMRAEWPGRSDGHWRALGDLDEALWGMITATDFPNG